MPDGIDTIDRTDLESPVTEKISHVIDRDANKLEKTDKQIMQQWMEEMNKKRK